MLSKAVKYSWIDVKHLVSTENWLSGLHCQVLQNSAAPHTLLVLFKGPALEQ